MKRIFALLIAMWSVAAFAATDWTTWAPDNDKIKLGDDSDFNYLYDSVQNRLELNDAAGNTLLHVTDDGTTGTLSATGKLASPLLNLTPGSAPGSPSNGDVWTTSAGLYARINGATVGPYLGSGGAGAFSTLDVSGQTAFGPGAAPGDYGNYVQNIFNSAPTQILTADTYRTNWTTLAPAPTGDTNAYYQALYSVVAPSLTAPANYTSRVEGAVIQVLPPATGKTMDHVYGVTAGTWWGDVGREGTIDELKNFNAENSCGVGDPSTWHGHANKMYGFFCDYMTYATHENYGLYILGVGGADTVNEAIHVEQGDSYFGDDIGINNYVGDTEASAFHNGSGATGQRSLYEASKWSGFSGDASGWGIIGLNVGLKSTDGSFVQRYTHASLGYNGIEFQPSTGEMLFVGAAGATTANAALTTLMQLTPTGLSVVGDVGVNGGDLTSSAATFNLLAGPTTIAAFAGATSGTMFAGATTGVTYGNLSAANTFNGLQKFFYGGPNAGFWLSDTQAYSATPRFAIDFVEKYNNAGSYTAMAEITGGKENATDGNYAGTILIRTRPNGGALTTAITISSAQAVTLAGALTSVSDTDGTTILGRVKLGSPTTDEATFAHFDNLTTTNYALKQTADGTTYVNAASTKAIYFDINNALCASVDATGILSQGSVWAASNLYGGTSGATRGILTLYHGAGGNTPGYAKLYSPNGTAWYLFVEDDGTVKIANAAPTANASGTEVGGQT